MSLTDLIDRLARSCARGHSQLGLVNELLVGPVQVQRDGFKVDGKYTVVYGFSRVGHASWKNLRRRLAENGFYFEVKHDTIKMKFSR